ncbi:MAG: putative inorganic carbon transporter subunit DabA, partial [Saprospiraceae bacterium]
MNHNSPIFREENVLHHLKHYLPAQAALKDFIHHNTLHAFQDRKFYDALTEASVIFGYKTSFSLQEYRKLYSDHKIQEECITKAILHQKGENQDILWRHKMIEEPIADRVEGRIGQLRSQWKSLYNIDLDLAIQPFLFRFICSYLDQGISIWRFPIWEKGFLTTIRVMEKNT